MSSKPCNTLVEVLTLVGNLRGAVIESYLILSIALHRRVY